MLGAMAYSNVWSHTQETGHDLGAMADTWIPAGVVQNEPVSEGWTGWREEET